MQHRTDIQQERAVPRRRTLIPMAAAAVVISGFALAPSAVGSTPRRPAPLGKLKAGAPAACKPSFTVVAQQKIGQAVTGTDVEGALLSVTEADQKHAYAVGLKEVDVQGGDTTLTGLVDKGNGKHWKLLSAPGGTPLDNSFLSAVGSTDNHDVWVAGFSVDPGATEPTALVLEKSKSGWHNLVIPHDQAFFSSVAVLSPDDVYVGGVTATNANKTYPVIFHYNGKAWSRTTFPSLAPAGVAALTVAGKTVVASMTATIGSGPVTGTKVKYLSGTKWKSLKFSPEQSLISLSGSSIHDLWATASGMDDTIVYHHTKHWTKTTLPDNEDATVSERTANPEGVWFAGESSSDDNFGAIDVLRNSGRTPASTEIADDDYDFFGIDAHVTNRVLAVGNSSNNDGTVSTLVEQATC